jgi:hypothetical protein
MTMSGKTRGMKLSVSVPDLGGQRLSFMPCLGRREAVPSGPSADEVSPTYQRIREVFGRRDELDARRAERKTGLVASRSELSEFKAQEQRHKHALEGAHRKELTSLRTLEAVTRKQLVDDLERRKQEVRQIEGNRKMAVAVEKAEDAMEDRRQKVAQSLEAWRSGCERAEQLKRHQDREKLETHKLTANSYSLKLQRVGDTHRNRADTQPQKNNHLKASIQSSLRVQLEDRRRREAGEMDEAINAKLEAASERRRHALVGSRYGFVERAFGEQAAGFDAKHQVSVDRRTRAWKDGLEGTTGLLGLLEYGMSQVAPPPGTDLAIASLSREDAMADEGQPALSLVVSGSGQPGDPLVDL